MKNIWAIIPVKPLNRSKSRLAPVLDIKQREALSREMLEQTLVTLKKAKSIGGILVVSRDSAALALARRYDAQTLQESGAPELNASLTRATKVISTWNASGALVLASDIPLMQVDDIEAMIALAKYPPVVVIAPDRRHVGTNGLLMCPPALFPYAFGEDSFSRHTAKAQEAGAEVHVYESLTMGLDVDLPADLDLYREMLMERNLNEPAWLGNA